MRKKKELNRNQNQTENNQLTYDEFIHLLTAANFEINRLKKSAQMAGVANDKETETEIYGDVELLESGKNKLSSIFYGKLKRQSQTLKI
mgnify:CR=1 FL=1